MANYKLYEYFGDASGNDDFLSDIGNTWEARRGMFAWTPYGVDEGGEVIYDQDLFNYRLNEEREERERFEVPESLQWDIIANMDYAKNMAYSSAKKLGLGELKYLGAGANGIAFEIDNERIFKLTTDISEGDASTKLIRAHPKYLAKVYGLYKVVDTENPKKLSAYIIIQENINDKPYEKIKIDGTYHKIIDAISPDGMNIADFFGEMRIAKRFDYNTLIQKAEKVLTDKPELNISEADRKEAYNFLVGLINIRKELIDFGIKSTDYTEARNLGYKNGVLKYFDYGGYSNVPEPNIGNNIIYLPEDGTSKFSTDDAIGQDEFPTYKQEVAEDLEYRHASDATKDEYVIDEAGKKAWMPGAQSVEVKKKCRLGGLGNTSVACNQGDIGNLDLKKIVEEVIKEIAGGKYYRAVEKNMGKTVEFEPEGFYEAIDDNGNPIWKYDTFWISDKPEVAASKSIGGAVMGLYSMFLQHNKNPEVFYIYEINEKPDVDISHWDIGDFAHLKEVRYRRPVQGTYKGKVTITDDMKKRLRAFYEINSLDAYDEPDEEYSEIVQNTDYDKFLGGIKNSVSEEIDAKEAYTDKGALKTVLNGKRAVGFVELTKDNIGKVQKYNIGVIPVRMRTGSTIMSIIYRPEGKDNAYRLYEIAKSHGGFLSDKSPDEAREIGRILGYREATIDEYIRRKYNKIPVLPEPSPDDYDDLSEGQISTLQDLPFKNDVEQRGGKVYSVGGAVRDEFLGKESKDLDVLVTGIPMEELEQLLSKYGRVDAVGKSFGVLKFRAQDGDEIDVAIPRQDTLKSKESIASEIESRQNQINDIESGRFEVLRPSKEEVIKKLRKEIRDLQNAHKTFDIKSDSEIPIEKDLERRDFTINAIAKDSEGNIVDPYGGQEDLKNKIIRIVNPEAFSDDPLRMLRAVQFASRFGFKIEPETLRMIQSTAERIKGIPPERILTEFDKIVKKGNKLTGAILLKSTGLLKQIFGKDAGLLMGQNIWENAKTMGEYIWLLSHNLVQNPAEFFKNNLKGDIDTYKEIKALQMAFDSGEATNMIEARAVASNMYLTSPQSLQSQILPAVIKTAADELLQGKYPKNVNELAVNGNDLMQLGLKGKEIGDMQKSLLLKVYANKIRNNREDLLALAGQNNNVIKEELSDRIEYGCLMLFLDVPIWERITSAIHPEDLYVKGGEYGVEKEPHLTILYGFHDEVTAEDVFDLVRESIPMRPIQVRITGISIFENPEFDVVKFDVNSPELTELNGILRQLPNTTKFPEYRAHITIAYVKSGEGKKYIKPFQGERVLKGDELVFTWKGHRGKEGGEVLKLSEIGALAETYPENKYVVNTQQLKVNYLLKKYDEWNNYGEKYIDPSRETVEEFIQQRFPDLIQDRKLKLDLYWALTDREVLNEIV